MVNNTQNLNTQVAVMPLNMVTRCIIYSINLLYHFNRFMAFNFMHTRTLIKRFFFIIKWILCQGLSIRQMIRLLGAIPMTTFKLGALFTKRNELSRYCFLVHITCCIVSFTGLVLFSTITLLCSLVFQKCV